VIVAEGSGEKLLVKDCAARRGILPSSWRSMVSRRKYPQPDGWYDARTPWWWESTVEAIPPAEAPVGA
jgi:hypothetical protein